MKNTSNISRSIYSFSSSRRTLKVSSIDQPRILSLFFNWITPRFSQIQLSTKKIRRIKNFINCIRSEHVDGIVLRLSQGVLTDNRKFCTLMFLLKRLPCRMESVSIFSREKVFTRAILENISNSLRQSSPTWTRKFRWQTGVSLGEIFSLPNGPQKFMLKQDFFKDREIYVNQMFDAFGQNIHRASLNVIEIRSVNLRNSFSSLLSVIKKCHLKELRLTWTSLNDRNIVALAKAMEKPPEVLDLSYNAFKKEGAEALGKMLSSRKGLHRLSILLTPGSAEGLIGSLKESTVTHINCQESGHLRADLVAKFLLLNPSIQELKVDLQKFDQSGGEKIGLALALHSICAIDLDLKNGIDGKGLSKLFHWMAWNQTLRCVKIYGMMRRKHMQYLNLNNLPIPIIGVRTWVERNPKEPARFFAINGSVIHMPLTRYVYPPVRKKLIKIMMKRNRLCLIFSQMIGTFDL